MKKSDIEMRSARIQKFRLRRSDSVYGILPEITFCLDRSGVATKPTQSLELFGVHTCEMDFLVDILRMFNAYYPHELAGRSAYIVFLDKKPVGICPLDSDCDRHEWMVCTKDGYRKLDRSDLFEALLH